MGNERFFAESREQSATKTTIVAKYFKSWSAVILPSAKQQGRDIAYIDLFAGPGRYEDGAKSTPLLILEEAVQNPDLRDHLVTIFNDLDSGHTQSLEREIDAIPG